ncbi:hypothetical protein Tco_0737274 [Tanacetum coccineum]
MCKPKPPSVEDKSGCNENEEEDGSNGRDTNVKQRLVMRGLEKRHVVTNSSVMDGMQRSQWFTDWMTNPSDHGLGAGCEMTPFVDNGNQIWPHPYFP